MILLNTYITSGYEDKKNFEKSEQSSHLIQKKCYLFVAGMKTENLLSKIFRREKREVSGDSIEAAINRALCGGDSEQASLSAESSLKLSTVWACVTLLADSISCLPVHLFEKTQEGRETVLSNKGLRCLNNPNSYLSRYDVLHHIMVSVNLWGNAYVQIIRDHYAVPVKLKLLMPYNVEPYLTDNDVLMYSVASGGMVESSDMIHVKGLTLNGYKGKSPITVHAENLLLTKNATDYGAKFFKDGGNIEGVFSVPNELSDKSFDRLKSTMQESYYGMKNAHRPMLLESGMKYDRLNIPLNDAQFLDTRTFQKEEIASIFRVPPHLIGDLTKSSYNTNELMGQEYVTYSLLPWAVKIESELRRKLLREDEQELLYFKFNMNSLMRADSKSRSEYYKNLNLIGVLSPNEIRELEDMNGYKGGEKYYVQQNMTDTESVGAQAAATNLKNKNTEI